MIRDIPLAWLVVAAVAVGAVGAVGVYAGGVPGFDTDDQEQPVDFGEEPVELEATHEATLDAETTVDDGTELQIRVRASDGQPFIHSEQTAVENGTLKAEFDLSDADPGQEVNITVHDVDGEYVTHSDGIIVEGGGESETGGESSQGSNVAIDDTSLELPAATNATVSGTADAESGTDVLVRLRSSSEDPFLSTNTTTVEADGSFAAQFDLSDIDPEADVELLVSVDDQTTTAEATVVEADWDVDGHSEPPFEVAFDETPLRLPAEENARLAGKTDLEPGTELMVRVRASGDQPFLKSQTTTVDEAGTFEVTYNLTSANPGQEVSVSLRADGESAESVDGEIVAAEDQ